MNTSTLPASATSTKPLWAAVGVLGVAVLALGASLVYVQSRPVDGHAALAALNADTPALTTPFNPVPAKEALDPREDLVAPPTKAPVAVVKPAPTRPVAKVTPPAATPAPVPLTTTTTGTNPASTGAPSVVTDTGGVIPSQPVPVAPRVVCAQCGTVEAVTPIQRKPTSGSGVGVVAGGALGAVLGNQIGKGSGRTLATILGAVGGGVAGNAIEKNMKKETVYQVQVRMEDGGLRTIEQASPATVGARVTVDGGVLRSADQSAAVPAPVRPKQPAPQPQPQAPDNSRA
jgi:outer membrane lipoprotein SlyB